MKTFWIQLLKPIVIEILTSEEFIKLIKSLLKTTKNGNKNN